MDNGGIASQLLRRLRGAPQVSSGTVPGTPPTDPSMQQQNPLSATMPQQSPLMFNQSLEQQAVNQGGQTPMNPMIQAIMQHLGLLNLIRNRSNQGVIDPTQGY